MIIPINTGLNIQRGLFVNLIFVIIFIMLKSNPLNTLAYAKKLKAVGFTDEQVYPVKCISIKLGQKFKQKLLPKSLMNG